MSQGKPKRIAQPSKKSAQSDQEEEAGDKEGGYNAMLISENALQKSSVDKTAEEMTPFTVESLQRKK